MIDKGLYSFGSNTYAQLGYQLGTTQFGQKETELNEEEIEEFDEKELQDFELKKEMYEEHGDLVIEDFNFESNGQYSPKLIYHFQNMSISKVFTGANQNFVITGIFELIIYR